MPLLTPEMLSNEMPPESSGSEQLPPEEATDETTEAEDESFVAADYTPQLTTIIDKQSEFITLMQQQNEILLEQVNGLSYIVNYQNVFLGVAILSIVVLIAYRVLFKWFFRGV